MRYWLGVVSKEHVMRGQAGGFAQVCHGKKGPLSRISKGDYLIYYSPGNKMGDSDLKSFTAIGEAVDDFVFQFEMTKTFIPFRRKIKYFKSKDVPVAELKAQLDLTQQPNWGYQLRRGLIELTKHDFLLISRAMGCSDGEKV
jgi:hypothetical protein